MSFCPFRYHIIDFIFSKNLVPLASATYILLQVCWFRWGLASISTFLAFRHGDCGTPFLFSRRRHYDNLDGNHRRVFVRRGAGESLGRRKPYTQAACTTYLQGPSFHPRTTCQCPARSSACVRGITDDL